jgi:ubiquinone/menaquinone biosynthesis C-methylase UbiE
MDKKKSYSKRARELYNFTYAQDNLNSETLLKISKEIKEKDPYGYYADLLSKEFKGNTLDLGCGPGEKTASLKIQNYTGADIAVTALKAGRKTYPKKRFICANAEKLPFKDNSFDNIIFFEIIEHIPNYQKSITEIKRILKKDGKLFIATPNRLRWLVFPFYYLMSEKFKITFASFFGKGNKEESRKLDQKETELSLPHHVKEFSKRELKKLCKKNNFKINSCKGYRSIVEYYFPKLKFLNPILPSRSILLIATNNKLDTAENNISLACPNCHAPIIKEKEKCLNCAKIFDKREGEIEYI